MGLDKHELTLVSVPILGGLVEVLRAELELPGEWIQQPFVFRRVVLERSTELVEVNAVETEHRHLLHRLDRVSGAYRGPGTTRRHSRAAKLERRVDISITDRLGVVRQCPPRWRHSRGYRVHRAIGELMLPDFGQAKPVN